MAQQNTATSKGFMGMHFFQSSVKLGCPSLNSLLAKNKHTPSQKESEYIAILCCFTNHNLNYNENVAGVILLKTSLRLY